MVAAMRLARAAAPRTRDLILLAETDEEGRSHPITNADLKAMHGNDERVPIAALEQGTDMLTRVLQDALG